MGCLGHRQLLRGSRRDRQWPYLHAPDRNRARCAPRWTWPGTSVPPRSASASASMRNSRRVDFETEVDWRESHILLKAAFPVNVFAPSATYEIQWGAIARRTHRNTIVGLRQVRGARAALGGPLGGRLRRRAAQRLQIRLRHPRRHDAADAHQVGHLARPEGRSGRAPLHLRAPAAWRRLAARRDGGGGRPQHAAAPPRRGGRWPALRDVLAARGRGGERSSRPRMATA